jgi:ribosomal protein S18 acetylase RimI-like enzyme
VIWYPRARGLPADLPDLRLAMVELQEHERRLDATTRLPGEQIADAHPARLRQEVAAKPGARFVAERNGASAGFAAGWIIERDHIPKSADSNRLGYLSGICVMPAYRRQRIAQRPLAALEQHLARAGITRFRLFGARASARCDVRANPGARSVGSARCSIASMSRHTPGCAIAR